MQKKVRMANLLFLPFLSVFPTPSHPFVHPFLPLSLLSTHLLIYLPIINEEIFTVYLL